MAAFSPGQVVLIRFPFTSQNEAKKRPALVVLDSGDQDLLLARITTQSFQSAWDSPLEGWKEAGLLRPCVVRLHKMASLEKTMVERVMGRLSPKDWEMLRSKGRQLFP